MDGTLLRRDGSVSDRTRRALVGVQDGGATVVLVTARAPDTLRPLALAAGISTLALCCNGAVAYDVERDAVLRAITMDVDTVRNLIVALRAALPGVAFGLRRRLEYMCEPAYRQLGGVLGDVTLGDALTLARVPAVKLVVRHPSLGADALLAHVQGLGLGGFEATHSGAPFVEISAPGVSKGFGLATLCADLGLAASDVVAFGDAPNDIPMLRWAGHGVAMANAHPSVLAVADEVAPSNHHDGVAATLERLFDLTTPTPRIRAGPS